MDAEHRNKTYYQQHPSGEGPGLRPATLTVGELIEQLQMLDPALPVIFKSPRYGCFGSGTTYALDGAKRVTLERQETRVPENRHFDEEAGEWFTEEPYTEVRPAWDGVVIE